MNYEQIKAFYKKGMWNDAMVKIAVTKGIITQAQYKEITGKAFK